jgi:hypothetical protein
MLPLFYRPLRNIADQHFPGAIQIVAFHHACTHLWDLARKLNAAAEPPKNTG